MTKIRDELLKRLEELSSEKQLELLAYARALAKSAKTLKGTSGKDLVVFSGAVEANALAKIARAIEEDCEQVDRSAW
jgi:hypothetical protein